VLGAAWALLQPLLTMVVFTVVFGRLAKIPADGVPHSLFYFSGLLIWTYFSQSMAQAAACLIADERLVTKIYFPRLIMPAAPVIGHLVDFVIAFLFFLVMIVTYGYLPSTHFPVAVLTVLLAIVTAYGIGTLLGALNVKYRDFRYVIPFLTQFWMFVSPVAYPASLIPEKWRLLYALNPICGAIEGFRWAMLPTDTDPWSLLLVSSCSALLLLAAGLTYFRRTERFFADFI